MLITLQGNIGASITTPIQKSFDDIIFCNTGGKSNMSLTYKNVPPMVHNDIPSELWIKDRTTDSVYSKIQSYSKTPQLSAGSLSEEPPFRFQIIYDGYDFLYYPEFKLYERPYLLLEYDTSLGNNIIRINKDGVNDDKNISYIAIGETITFKDYNTTYTIASVIENSTNYDLYLDRNLDELYYQNDIIVFANLKYEVQSTSNILNDSTISALSPFKFKFINTFNSKTQFMTESLGKSEDYTLINGNYTDIVDIWGDDKFVSLSSNVDTSASATITINVNLNETDTQLELTGAPTTPLDVYSYLTIKSDNGLEIVKITEKLSDILYTIERAQMNTVAIAHSGSVNVWFPKYIYFVMLPYNKELTKRYVLYRNVDFVLTWV